MTFILSPLRPLQNPMGHPRPTGRRRLLLLWLDGPRSLGCNISNIVQLPVAYKMRLTSHPTMLVFIMVQMSFKSSSRSKAAPAHKVSKLSTRAIDPSHTHPHASTNHANVPAGAPWRNAGGGAPGSWPESSNLCTPLDSRRSYANVRRYSV
jgi:hypothetical protein